ncbi:MAG: hypothetical protein A2Y71_03105 [Bacteroidetes bacterium RBG_13_42_15]|nr:MAG: hypothetical protein A2Y71_03105 [Bacteroidetes bacterium RBG_13_42_15]
MDFEAEHIRRLILLEQEVEDLFNRFLSRMGLPLSRIQIIKEGVVWKHNPGVEHLVNTYLRQFAQEYKDLLLGYAQTEWIHSEQKNDDLLMKFLKGLGVVIAGSMLLKIFNRKLSEGMNADLINLGNIATQKRRYDAVRAYLKQVDKRISPRVWRLCAETKQLLTEYLAAGLSKGRSAARISQDIRSLLKNPDARFRRVRDPETGKLIMSKPMAAYHPGQGVYRSAYKNALRMARNEVNMAYRRSDCERWKNTEFVLGYEVQLSNAHIETDICNDLVGFYPKGFVFMGWHVQCLCHAVPVLPSKKDFVKYLESGHLRQGVYTKNIPGKAKEFISNNSEKLIKAKLQFIKENFTQKGKELILNI